MGLKWLMGDGGNSWGEESRFLASLGMTSDLGASQSFKDFVKDKYSSVIGLRRINLVGNEEMSVALPPIQFDRQLTNL